MDDWLAQQRAGDAHRASVERSTRQFQEAVAAQRDARALAGNATLDDQRAYYAAHGRTPDGRVLPDDSERIQRACAAVLERLASADAAGK